MYLKLQEYSPWSSINSNMRKFLIFMSQKLLELKLKMHSNLRILCSFRLHNTEVHTQYKSSKVLHWIWIMTNKIDTEELLWLSHCAAHNRSLIIMSTGTILKIQIKLSHMRNTFSCIITRYILLCCIFGNDLYCLDSIQLFVKIGLELW